jgi:hypothetical protein
VPHIPSAPSAASATKGSLSGSKADDVRDNKYRLDLVGPCSIGQTSVTAADDADGADAKSAALRADGAEAVLPL